MTTTQMIIILTAIAGIGMIINNTIHKAKKEILEKLDKLTEQNRDKPE